MISRANISIPRAVNGPAGRRRHSRLRVQLPAQLITLDGTLAATLLNLSYSGAKLTIPGAAPRVGAWAVLKWAGFEAFCLVAWNDGDLFGLDFESPLKPNVLLATRDIADVTPPVDGSRTAARDWAIGYLNRS